MISVYKKVKSIINNKDDNEIFTAYDISITSVEQKQVSNALSKLANENIINRLSKGKYYRPKKTRFGVVKPSDDDVINKVIKDMYKKTKMKPYFASNSVYQKLGLTTQVSAEIFLVCNINVSYNFAIKNLKFNLIKFKGNWNKNNIQHFEFLYALQNIKKIPDNNVDDVYTKLMHILSTYGSKPIVELAKSAKYFNNRTKAILGTIMEQLGFSFGAEILKKELNPKTNYYIDIDNKIIPRHLKTKWRIYDTAR